ncbi:hypothetical protein IU501_19285 [Nocardia otitidiscaviarum]|uniref:Uncharacterized protein n=1 Tax=Nocardia otitidiscaviarum TaxID=1823 RepID=A0A378YVA7_9NOCA|nr:hypothetical protein [Nocardia otitidiscaviarum]MBF6135137.1 hypothetical protein [Nocardia otitidiscaviarum]MBF6486959.1 hypothetical protein [Nocardia otitidiscaviarum]SUA80359.1 Uncharacterised protein [Nocardia otitidiscaviarum]
MNDWPPVPMWHRSVPVPPGRPPLVWLVGVHGGAGVTSLAASMSWAGDAGRRWPGRIGLLHDMDSPLVVLVARTHMSGVNALEYALLSHQNDATPAGSRLVGVVTVADSARPLPESVARRRQVVEARAVDMGARAWRLNWIEPWRELEPHRMPVWDPAAVRNPVDEGDATRTPPQPVRHLAEQIFLAARAAGIALTAPEAQQTGHRDTG